ncbi:tetratricopeptide repeat protein [Kitasatospora sp. NPDC094019]|uniref:tetratricopeptide repeat protein n=1 Tax=Kitasatospora sp. NPDC094019 TaxID=3364091 RepID=UPI0037FEF05E
MAATPPAEPNRPSPNTVMRALRGDRSPGEFALAVRRAAREIGEHVSCDARYIGRVESGEIRCPNYAYERVFRHMWPDRPLTELGFAPRIAVRRRSTDGGTGDGAGVVPGPRSGPPPGRHPGAAGPDGGPPSPLHPPFPPLPAPRSPLSTQLPYAAWPYAEPPPPEGLPVPRFATAPRGPAEPHHPDEENDDVRRRTFLAGGPAALATVIGIDRPAPAAAADAPRTAAARPWPPARPGPGDDFVPGRPGAVPPPRKVGAAEVFGVEQAVREIRLADDAHGADALFEQAGRSLRSAYVLLDACEYSTETERRLQAGAGELAVSVGWLAHDSNRLADARSYYAEALATARMAGDAALEAHVFCNSAFLARDAGRPREALRAAQAGQSAARELHSDRLFALLAMREAGGWALLQDRAACERAVARACRYFDRGPSGNDPEWMSFFGEAELAGLQAQCWSALGDWERASERAGLAIALQKPHFVRNRVLYTAELAHDRLGRGDLAGAAEHGSAAVKLFDDVRSARIRSMLADTAQRLRQHRRVPEVGRFLAAYGAATAAA